MSNPPAGGSREALREGLAEVRQKIGSDLSNWAKLRRAISLQRQITCETCSGAGRTACSACGGSGASGVSATGERTPCGACGGSGSFTCVECAGKGLVDNPHRKRTLILVWIGCACWALVFLLFYLQERDILPGFRAQGGGAMDASRIRGGGHQAPMGGGGYQAPMGRGGGYQAPMGGGGYQAPMGRGGGYQAPMGGGAQMPPGR
jgi:hypothetical protein